MDVMTQISQILFYILMAFIGYAIGRISHILGGHLKSPHHWIYGLVLTIAGLFYYSNYWVVYIIVFGIGLFISDFKDFLNMKFYGVDDVKIKKFWGID